jgi:hypothetical protein
MNSFKKKDFETNVYFQHIHPLTRSTFLCGVAIVLTPFYRKLNHSIGTISKMHVQSRILVSSKLPWCDLLFLFFLDLLEGQRIPIGTNYEKFLQKLNTALVKKPIFSTTTVRQHIRPRFPERCLGNCSLIHPKVSTWTLQTFSRYQK